MARPRFLGWRQWVAITPDFMIDFEDDESAPHETAIWSDEDTLRPSTDGFDIAAWRVECSNILAKGSTRRRVPLAKSARLKFPPLSGVVESPRQLDFDVLARRAAYGGAVASGPRSAMAIKPVHLPAISDVRQPLSQCWDMVPSTEIVEAMSSMDPQLFGICRGEVASGLAKHKGELADLAQKRRAHVGEAGKQARDQAAQWRRRRKELGKTIVTTVHLSPAASTSQGCRDKETERVIRVRKVIERLKGVSSVEIDISCQGAEPRKRIQTIVPVQNTRSTVEKEQDVAMEKKLRMAALKQRVLARMIERQKQARKHTRIRSLRKDRFRHLPEAERKDLQEAFAMYADSENRISAAGMFSCLCELGLRGASPEERASVEVIVRNYASDGTFGLSPDGASIEAEHLPVKKQAHFASNAPSPDGVSSPVGMTIEDFCTEVVPAVRMELHDERTDVHFHAFMVALADGQSVSIAPHQFKELAVSLDLDPDVVHIAMTALPKAASDGTKKVTGKHRRENAVHSHEPVELDFDAVHNMLMHLEEQTERVKRKRERKILATTKISEIVFWTYRHELLLLFDTFNKFDADHSGFLSHEETKQLLKKLGLQPYAPHMSLTVERFLRDADTDGNSEIDFGEFLTLMDTVRNVQRERRETKLVEQFKRFDTDNSGQLEPAEIVKGLTDAGLVMSRSDKEIADAVIQEFDADLSGGLCFKEFEELSQRIVERIFTQQNNRFMLQAKTLGFDMDSLAEYQWAFDHLDVDGSGTLCIAEVELALRQFMLRPPPLHDLEHLFQVINKDNSGEVSFDEFLELMKTVAGGKGALSREEPFTIRESIPADKQRDILSVFPIAGSYIRNLEPQELLETVCNFTGLKADANLRDLPQPIRNVRQLTEYAKKVAAHGGMPGVKR